MRKTTISAVAIVLSALVFVLSGCEMSVNISDEESTTAEPDTAVVEITNEKGTVVATENVTMSKKDKEDSKKFFETSKNTDKGVSKDRVQQAIKDQGLADDGSDTLEDEMNQAEQVQDDMAVLKSNQYLVNARLVMDGKTSPYKIARKGKKSSMTFVHEGHNMGLIITEKSLYLLTMDDKQYVEFPKSLLEEQMTDEEMKMVDDNWFDMEREVKKTTTEKVDGVKYKVIVYKSGAKDYFVGKTLIKTTAEDGSTMYYDSISPIAPSSLFYPPKGYTKADVDLETTSEVPTTECTDPNHNHNEE